MKKNDLNECVNRVKLFMHLAKQEINCKPTIPSSKAMELRYKLIEEELGELREAMGFDGKNYDRQKVDMEKVYDALLDIAYVTFGGFAAFGLDFEKGFKEVCDSNDSKFAEGYSIRKDGKLIKSPLYKPAELKKLIN